MTTTKMDERRALHDEIRRLRETGMTQEKIAEQCGVSRNTVYRLTTPGAAEKHRATVRRWIKKHSEYAPAKCACGATMDRRAKQCRPCYVLETTGRPVDALVPVRRLQAVVVDELRSMSGGAGLGSSTLTALGERCGVHWATIDKIAKGEQLTVTFDTADKILTGIGETYLWYIPAEQGGLADLYERVAA